MFTLGGCFNIIHAYPSMKENYIGVSYSYYYKEYLEIYRHHSLWIFYTSCVTKISYVATEVTIPNG